MVKSRRKYRKYTPIVYLWLQLVIICQLLFILSNVISTSAIVIIFVLSLYPLIDKTLYIYERTPNVKS